MTYDLIIRGGTIVDGGGGKPYQARRFDQVADGYVATIVSGTVIAANGRPTGALPGRLVPGRRRGP